ncbi:Endonuclease/exonuclease/phosphatase [Roridomyces roridus]|uniref:Endonuclease/exonuclease/phosphatase n=1 Tax=Roridomyces roridus TaxID=1738132 RepID=A0AAD7CGH6_9AGAR|nr:Endonuclease/exonuclease/phosphatase [Roridomyces roridus]
MWPWSTFFGPPVHPLPPPVAPQPATNHLYKFDPARQRWTQETSPDPDVSSINPNSPFSIISWNIDFSRPLPLARFGSALTLLQQLLSPHLVSLPPPPTILLLQEMHHTCFGPLLSNGFIREFYEITNIASPQSYSTVTLVPKSLAPLVSCVSRVAYMETQMSRDCVYVDLDLPAEGGQPFRRLRIANTHLESLRGFGDVARPKQLEAVYSLLTGVQIHGGLVAGDMNAITPEDATVPQSIGFTDSWLVGRAATEPPEGHTWGYQPPSRFPPGRLDKILTVGNIGCVDIQRIGLGAKVEGRDVWISDHYGLFGKVVLR